MAQPSNDNLEDEKTRPQFGTRFLTEEQNVFQHNAWLGKVFCMWYTCYVRYLSKMGMRTIMSRVKMNLNCLNLNENKWLYFMESQTHSGLLQVSPVVGRVARRYLANRPSGGGRSLPTHCSQAYLLHNNWDNVVWDAEQEEEAKQKTLEQAAHALSKDEQEKYDSKADQFWDDFYGIHQNRFFKDRHWLFTEFPELNCSHIAESNKDTVTYDSTKNLSTDTDYPGAHAKYRFLEVGCGVGNTVFPVVQTNNNPDLMVYCCDFSATGVKHVKEHPDYDPNRCHAFVCDVAKPESPVPFPDASLDVIIMIFVLSAIHPDKIPNVIERLVRYLKPGGLLLFRDYGRYDMAQLRFKKGRCLSENFYVRGDGTRVYFFEQEELRQLFTKSGLVEEQNLIDRRLQVNRGKQLKMYRVWIQCKYRKPTQQQ